MGSGCQPIQKAALQCSIHEQPLCASFRWRTAWRQIGASQDGQLDIGSLEEQQPVQQRSSVWH